MSVEVAFTVAAYGLILGIFAGWSTFRVMYRPWRSRDHSLVGRHLIRTADSMIALTGVSLIGAVHPPTHAAHAGGHGPGAGVVVLGGVGAGPPAAQGTPRTASNQTPGPSGRGFFTPRGGLTPCLSLAPMTPATS